ncbi:MAG: AMP-binding protein, partial [Xanthobacteraceae bacterium]
MAGLELSYVDGASGQPLIGKTIGQFFDEACAKWPSRPALVVRHQKVRFTYGELRQAVDKLAAGLLTLGLVPGDRIG